MRYALPLFILLFLSSCFHKDVLTDRADDVATAFIYTGTEGTFIITKEEIFQATSKESNGGMTMISGSAEYRITAYDINTGQQTGRIDMGDGQEESFTILGATPGKIWLYSIDPELGLHCRNPKTLEVISNEAALTAAAPLKGFAFARPEWMKLDQHYGWKADNGMLMLTDMQGFHYYYDPAKNTLEKTEDAIPDYDWATNELGSTGYFSKDRYVSLRGDGRQKLMYQYEDSTGKLSYLHGELVLDINPLHAVERKKNYVAGLDAEMKSWQDSLAAFYAKYPDIPKDLNPRDNYQLYRAHWKVGQFNREIESLQRDKKDAERPAFSVFSDPLLSDGEGTLFVIHATDVTDTAKTIVSKVTLKDRAFTEAWTLKLPDFYRDPDKADSKGAFETVFSDGNPEFDYQWFELAGDKLIIISQLQMICIDAKTGKIAWEHPL